MKASEGGGGGCCSGKSKRSKSAGGDIAVKRQTGAKGEGLNG